MEQWTLLVSSRNCAESSKHSNDDEKYLVFLANERNRLTCYWKTLSKTHRMCCLSACYTNWKQLEIHWSVVNFVSVGRKKKKKKIQLNNWCKQIIARTFLTKTTNSIQNAIINMFRTKYGRSQWSWLFTEYWMSTIWVTLKHFLIRSASASSSPTQTRSTWYVWTRERKSLIIIVFIKCNDNVFKFSYWMSYAWDPLSRKLDGVVSP